MKGFNLHTLLFLQNCGSDYDPVVCMSFEAGSFDFALEVLPLYEFWYIIIVFILRLSSFPSIFLL